MNNKTPIVLTAFAFLLWTGCTKDEQSYAGRKKFVLPAQVDHYDEVPAGLPFDPFNGITINNHQATLGRVLFFEPALSKNYRISCGTCHKQEYAFSDNVQFSRGFENKLTDRNTPSIVNLGLQTDFFWDMRENVLGDMVLQPVAHPVEMGLDNPDEMVARIAAIEAYDSLFVNAFGDEEVTVERLSLALEQFSRAMVSIRSKFDEGQSTNFSNFSESELRGKDLFFVGLPCSGCHGGHVLSGAESQPDNIGLEEHYRDPGVSGINPVSGQVRNGFFKTPSLRNIELSAPYMHDGRFKTLMEVVEFYNSGIRHHPQLSFMLRKNTNGGFFFMGHDPQDVYLNNLTGVEPLRMHMTNQQKEDLVAFLKTLTDDQLMFDPKFSDPFVVE
jgi:cytochrome c peroxidase